MANSVILGLDYGGHDTSAVLMRSGVLVAACEQERYDGVKHSRNFPTDAVADCLRLGGLDLEEVDEIAFSYDPLHYIRETYLRTALNDERRIGFLIKDIDRIERSYNMEALIRERTGFQGPITFHLHHLCHMASAYFPSGFDEALLASYDGMGEIETGMLGTGRNGVIEILDASNRYPDSVGLLYSAITYYLGFKHHCDEGIVMGLASYGDPSAQVPGQDASYEEILAEILEPVGDFGYRVNLDWVAYHHVRDTWISPRFIEVFGPRRLPGEPLQDHHRHLAAALQKRMEQIVLGHLRVAQARTGLKRLALAGGVALNCSLNGAIEASGLFDEIFVQPAAGDSGAPIGACYLSYQRARGSLAPTRFHDFYLGSGFTDAAVETALKERGLSAFRTDDIWTATAQRLAEGKIVGWFQGRSEFGPRALGNRSILTRPYPAEMKDYLNARVKFREEFRPFAPAVIGERTEEFFRIRQPSPHMLIACKAVPENAHRIPATVHVDGTCRVQTVGPDGNQRFRRLLETFANLTGCPVLLNTSFNVKGQPIVNTPAQAIDCFLNTNIDFLALGDFFLEKETGNVPPTPG